MVKTYVAVGPPPRKTSQASSTNGLDWSPPYRHRGNLHLEPSQTALRPGEAAIAGAELEAISGSAGRPYTIELTYPEFTCKCPAPGIRTSQQFT